jgi:hypothetical protein
LWYRLKDQRDEFNEYYEIRQGWILIAIFGVVNMVVWIIKKSDSNTGVGVKIFARFLLFSCVGKLSITLLILRGHILCYLLFLPLQFKTHMETLQKRPTISRKIPNRHAKVKIFKIFSHFFLVQKKKQCK